jgi:hypothetical protein
LGQTQICGGVKPVNVTLILPSWQLDLQRQYIHKQPIKHLHRFAYV